MRALLIQFIIIGLAGCSAPLPREVPFDSTGIRPGPVDWTAAFATPQDIEVTALVTGEVKVARSVLIDLDHADIVDGDDRDVWVPVLAYLVRHPRHGAILLDSGFDASFTDSGHGNFGGLAALFGSLVEFTRQSAGHDVVSLLHKAGVEPGELEMILLSHAHLDHTAGLPGLPASVPVVGGPGAILGHDVKWYAPTDHFAGRTEIASLSFEGAPDSGPGRTLDLFGDGSIFVVSTPGHAPGNLSVIINGIDGPALLTFDASHLQEGFRDGVAPGKVSDRSAADLSLNRMRAFAKANPSLRIFPGHELPNASGAPGLLRLIPSAHREMNAGR